MLSLSHFFAKFKNIERSEKEKISEVVQIVKNISGIDVLPAEVVIEEGSVRITASPLKRNEIFMYKEQVLEELQRLKLFKLF